MTDQVFILPRILGIIVPCERCDFPTQNPRMSHMTDRVNLELLFGLGDATRNLTEPEDIMKVIATRVGEFLNASRCAYADVEEDGERFTIYQDYTNNCASTAGQYQLSAFGTKAVAKLNRGETLVINHVDEELSANDGGDAFRALGIQAIICCALVKQEKLVAMMAVHQIEPRQWQPNEISLMEDVVERCWETIERARLQKLVARNEAKFRDFFEYAPDAQVLVDRQGIIQLANRCFVQLFELGDSPVTGRPASDLLPYSIVERNLNPASGLSEEKPRDGGPRAIQIRTQAGNRVYIEINQNLIQTDEGAMAVLSIRDVSDRIRLEEELRQAKKMETVGLLAGGIAHDFNNLLTVILGSSELALRGEDLGEETRKDLEAIHKASSRAGELTQQLLAFSRQQVLKPERIDLNATLIGSEELLNRLIGEDIAVRLELDRHLPAVNLDITQLQQVVLNLAANAKDAMAEGGTVNICTREVQELPDDLELSFIPDCSFVQLSFSDNGQGIDPDKLDTIFEPFYTTKGTGKGTGLGLSTVYGIVTQSQGYITVSSELGKGTTFRLFFPSAGDAPVQGEQSRQEPEDDSQARILIVEDEPALAEILAEMLELIGYSVKTAASGEEALEIFNEWPDEFDLVITDVIMPGINGSDLAKKVKELNPETRILFTSGYTADAIGDHGVLDKDQNFLSKPYRFDELKKTVSAVLND